MSYDKQSGLYYGYIYCIENNVTGKKYIGQTSASVDYRWKQHKNAKGYRSSKSIYLYKSMNKYGIDKFTITTICSISSETATGLKQKLNLLEKEYIERHVFQKWYIY